MDFNNLVILTKGSSRTTTGGSKKASVAKSNFDVRFSNYTKTTKSGDVKVQHFAFTSRGLEKLGVLAADKAAAPFFDKDNLIAGIVVVDAESPAAALFVLSKRTPTGKKSHTVSSVNLVNAMIKANLLNIDFKGTTYFDLGTVIENGGNSYFPIEASSNQPKPYGGVDGNDEPVTSM